MCVPCWHAFKKLDKLNTTNDIQVYSYNRHLCFFLSFLAGKNAEKRGFRDAGGSSSSSSMVGQTVSNVVWPQTKLLK